MTTTAKIILDSVSIEGRRLTTLQLRYPRFIHAEFMTHRVFSRNASSSRAIPVERLIQDVIDDPAIPCHWGKNQPGMQAREEHSEPIEVLLPYDNDGVYSWRETDPAGLFAWETSYDPASAWLVARDLAVVHAQAFAHAGYHKQVANRLLEPFAHMNVVVTATEWDNFFKLRLHEDAEPNIQLLARVMKDAMDASRPAMMHPNQWHLPYLTAEDEQRALKDQKYVSVARCARVSFKTHDGQPTAFEKDLDLGIRLATSGHWSPFEHQAHPNQGRAGNLRGWRSFRTELGQ